MGGVKKKSLASMEKSQESQDEQQTQPSGAAKTGKKAKEQKSAPQQSKRLPFLAPSMTEAEMLKTLAPLKAITVGTASRALGVNVSIATGIIRNLEGKSLLAKQGGFSGHAVWAVAQKS